VSWLDTVKQYIGQIAAGAVEGTVADSHIKKDADARKKLEAAEANGNVLNRTLATIRRATDPRTLLGNPDYRPAIVDAIPATYGVIKSLITGDAPKEGTYVSNSIDRAMAASDRTNRTFGITDPTNAAQMALRVGGGLIAPSGKAAPITAVSRLGRAAQVAKKVAVETALPLRQTSVKTALATQVPIGVGLREGIDAVADVDEYTGLADQFRSDDPSYFNTAASEDPSSFGDVALAPDDPSFFAEAIGPTNADLQEASQYERWALGAAAVIGGGLTFGAAKYGLSRIKAGPVQPSQLVGTQTITSPTSLADRAVAGVLQHDQVARNSASQYMSPDDAAQWNFNSDRIIPQALGAKIKNTLVTGRFPGSTVKTKPIAPLLQSIAKDLQPAEHTMLADGLLARSALDDYNRTGTQAAFNDKTPAELAQMADLVDNDPKLSKYADAVREQYRSLLRYRLEQGFISQQSYQDMVTARPNYVHMSRDVVREGGPNSLFSGTSGNALQDEQFARQLEEYGGVQAGGTRNPIDELQSRYVATIRSAQLNEHKRTLFDGLMNSSAVNATIPDSNGKPVKYLSRLPDEPKSMEGVHTVWRDGRPEYYKVGDPSLDRALRYSPKATMPVLGQLRQIAQFFTTGAGNPLSAFGATVSPVYDTLSGMVFRPQGTDLGVINEALNKLGSPVNLGRLDPTSLISAPIGALRSSFDELTGSLATSLSDQLLRDHGPILSVLGDAKTTALRDFLQSRYDSSIRSMLDDMGVSSHQQWGADNAAAVPTGLETVAPAYVSDMSRRAAASVMQGDHTFVEGMLAQSKNAFTQAKSSTIARMYAGVLRNMQEGFKYQFAATNMPKVKSMADLNELMSTTRRISSDAGQYGGSDAWNKIADSIMYANVGTQALGEWGRRIASNPLYTLGNAATTIGTLAALRYGAMISDPEVWQKVQDRTDQQNTSSVPTFGGIDIPVEPTLRPVTGPLFAVLDRIAMDENGHFNRNFVEAIYSMFDDDASDMNEVLSQRVKNSFLTGLAGANPINPSSSPLFAGAMAYAGADPGMTRISGEVSPVRVQQADAMGGEGKTTDTMLSGYQYNLINALIGSGLTNIVDVAEQWQRAALSQNANGTRGVSPAGAAKVALSQLVDSASKTKGPLQGMLFKDYEASKSVATTDYTLMKDKQDGIDKATAIFGDMRRLYTTGVDPRTSLMKPLDLVPPNYAGTPLAVVGAIALELDKELNKINKLNAALIKQQEVVRNQKTTTIENRNAQLNDIVVQRQFLYTKMLQITRQAEDAVGQAVQDENFTFDDFSPEKYSQ
jgi:hypothetical protein